MFGYLVLCCCYRCAGGHGIVYYRSEPAQSIIRVKEAENTKQVVGSPVTFITSVDRKLFERNVEDTDPSSDCVVRYERLDKHDIWVFLVFLQVVGLEKPVGAGLFPKLCIVDSAKIFPYLDH